VLRYWDEDDEIECAASYSHEHEIKNMTASPNDASLVLTVHNNLGTVGASIWRMPALPPVSADRFGDRRSEDVAPKELQTVAHFPALPKGSKVMHSQWLPSSSDSAGADDSTIVTVDDTSVKTWKLRGSGSLDVASDFAMDDVTYVGDIAWDTLHPSEMAVATDSSVQCWDLRSGNRIRTIVNAVPAGACVRSVSYNINKPWHLASAGDDFRVKVWDVRKPSVPVKVLDGHTHWYANAAAVLVSISNNLAAFLSIYLAGLPP
jgi:WD40 repeat protein